MSGFNPRARRGARVAGPGSGLHRARPVSILARAEARALPGALLHGRRVRQVSILARAEARALRLRFGKRLRKSAFQSSRAPRRARCSAVFLSPCVFLMFQSSRAPRRARCARAITGVDTQSGFNPRARRGARVASAASWRRPSSLVSILARAEARALPHIAAGSGELHLFQSSRAPRRARCRFFAARPHTLHCFNPRARRGARVAPGASGTARSTVVSILARAEARALLEAGESAAAADVFQSSRAPRRARCGSLASSRRA